MQARNTHPYLPSSHPDIKKALMREIGITSIDQLYEDIPSSVRLKRELNLPPRMSEFELYRHIDSVLAENRDTFEILSFLGSGCWPHYVPAAVSEVASRSEFVTSYTPYQPEVSQGMLQALFEYQSLICELTGMEFANSSLYDWASALGEAARMASRITQRDEFLIPRYIHPDRRATLLSYCEPASIKVIEIEHDPETGQIDLEDLSGKVSDKTAGVYVENPSFLGCVDTEVEEIGKAVHAKGGLFVAGIDPLSLGILKAPADYGVDIVIGEGQSLGNPMNYGGPLLGIFACKEERLLRHMPGRVIGITTTKEGAQRSFCMTLQTREQHIRREKATSNICTNEALCAVAAAIYLSLLGPIGLKRLGEKMLARSQYAISRLASIRGVTVPAKKSPVFKEFTLNIDKTGKTIRDFGEKLLNRNIQIGLPLKSFFPELGESAVFCTTERHSTQDIDRLHSAVKEALEA
ncbi:MAG: aminomethyl-transferring glycine dehydrogenase subunit GcvPA [archaeon]